MTHFFESHSIQLDFNRTYFILGPYDREHISTAYIILYTKFFIYMYRCKCQNSSLSLPGLLTYLRFMIKVLEQTYKNENKLSEFEKEWYKWKQAL